MAKTENTMAKREKRIADVVALKTPDRVPFAPKIGVAYSHVGMIDMYEALMDFRNMREGVERFVTRWETDLFWSPAGYPSNMMEVLGTSYINWPGATKNLSLDSGFQITDQEFMSFEEYDELIENPAHFFMTKVFPRKHAKLKGLEKLSFNNVVEFGHFASMAVFADPEVRATLLTLMHAGDEALKWLSATQELCKIALDNETPLGCIVGQGAPYDMLADNIRGFLNVPMDKLEHPEKVLAAIDVMTRIGVRNVDGIKAAGLKYCFMPLHGGTDDFMSDEDYKKFYWPSLRKVIERQLELGITPYILFEGKYNTRLDAIRDIPPGKAIYMFEQVDIVQAKKDLGDVACVAGNLSSTLLAFGKKEEIVDATKRMIDECAPGGGFIMDCFIVLENFKHENMDAWFEATMEHGKY